MDMIRHGTVSAYSYHGCRCEICVRAKREKDRDYYERNREARKAKNRQWSAANKARRAQASRAYRLRNADRIKAMKRAYYDAHRQEIIDNVAAWIKANPERRKEQTARHRDRHRDERRADSLARYRKRMMEDPDAVRAQRRAWAKTPKGRLANRAARSARRGAEYTPEALAWIRSLSDPRCAYCGGPATEIDHVIPISLGGTGERDNLVPACRKCNAAKNNLPLDEFIDER
jgi:5-methylcytosine-specific restriction endonuclease McrA